MVWTSKKKTAPLLAQLSFPCYCINAVGSRHLLVAGGGGSSATGVKNELQVLLLTYNQFSTIPNAVGDLVAKKTGSVDTKPRATMNLDIVPIGPASEARYVVAAGQDDFCVFYESNGFTSVKPESDIDSPCQLSLGFQEFVRIKTVDGSGRSSYQKCVRFDRSTSKILRVATGATDGYVRIWNASSFLENRDPTVEKKPITEFVADKCEVLNVDFSFCGSFIVTVCDSGNVALWNPSLGRKVADLPQIPQIPAATYKCRTVRFVNLRPQSQRSYMIAVHNCRVRNSKQTCILSLWAFDPEKKQFQTLEVKVVARDSICAFTVSPCQQFCAIGTGTGAVAVFTTTDFEQLYFMPETHRNFVTAVDFLPRRTLDVPGQGRLSEGTNSAQVFLPGVTSDSLISIVSMSIDQHVQLHSVPFPESTSFSQFWMKVAAWMLLFYFIFWIVFVY